MDFVSLVLSSMKKGENAQDLTKEFEFPFFVTLKKRLMNTFKDLDLDKLLKFFREHHAHVFGSWIIEGLTHDTFEDADIDLIFPASELDAILTPDESGDYSWYSKRYSGLLTEVLEMKCPESPCHEYWHCDDRHHLLALTDYGLMHDKCDGEQCKLHKNLKLVLEGYLPSGKKINVVFVDNDPVEFIMSAKDISITQNVFSFRTFVLHSESKENLRLREFTVPELTMDDCPRYRWWSGGFNASSSPPEEAQIVDGGWYEPSSNLKLDRKILQSRVAKYKRRGFKPAEM